MCGRSSVRDAHPQAHDAALHQSVAQAPAVDLIGPQRHREDLPHLPPRRVPGGAQRSRGHARHRCHLQHAPPVLQGTLGTSEAEQAKYIHYIHFINVT